MTHDKIKAAARKRMTETGEPYAAARREVLKDQAARHGASSSTATWFAVDDRDIDRFTRWTDSVLRRDSAGGVQVGSSVLRVRWGGFHLDIPRSSVRSVTRSDRQTRGTIGVHARRGDWLVNGSREGLVELVIDPPCDLPRRPTTIFRKMEVRSLTIGLVDPDGFIAAVQANGG
jgi:hypothetical protein